MEVQGKLLRKPPAAPLLLCVPLAALGLVALRAAFILPAMRVEFAVRSAILDAGQIIEELPCSSLLSAGSSMLNGLTVALTLCGALWIVAAILGLLFRRPWVLKLIRAAHFTVPIVAFFEFGAAYIGGGKLAEFLWASEINITALELFVWRWSYLRWMLLASAVAGCMLLLSWRRKTIDLYGGQPTQEPAPGDAVLEDIRTGGRDPRYRRSVLGSSFLHYFIIIVLPFLWGLRGCVEDYLVPHGSGKAAVMHVMKTVKIKKKKKRKKYMLKQNSAVFWEIPDLDVSKIAKEVDEETQVTHVADRSAVHGALGAGGGTKGGWPEGVPGGKIRFIRLKHGGRDWDDGMDEKSAADINFLNFVRQEVPFPVARKGEAHEARLLPKYTKGFAPPFIYLTGEDRIDMSAQDMRVLREYLMDGGMLLADCGGPRWDGSFKSFIKGVLPGYRLIDIPDDDTIFQMPYTFSNGAPSLWHHGGMRAQGIKHKGRWIVFYHPGDMNDAWKTGSSGMDPELADKAFQMGINVVYYAITNYLELTKKYRKL